MAFVVFSSEKRQDTIFLYEKRAELSWRDIIPSRNFQHRWCAGRSLIVVVSSKEAYSHLRTTRNVHTVNKCTQNTQVLFCPRSCSIRIEFELHSRWKKFRSFSLFWTARVWSFFSIVFFLNSKISLECMHFNGYFNLSTFHYVYFSMTVLNESMHKLGLESCYLHNWNLQLNKIFVEIITHDFNDWVYVRCFCVRLLCWWSWIWLLSINVAFPSHHITASVFGICSSFAFLFHWIPCTFLCEVSFWENKTREIYSCKTNSYVSLNRHISTE